MESFGFVKVNLIEGEFYCMNLEIQLYLIQDIHREFKRVIYDLEKNIES